ncbi:MAG: hypothetical protein ABI954_00465 [Pyrinomonadaceae bacterium]
MSSKHTLTIKDYHNRGGDLTVEINVSITSEKIVNSVKIIKLKVTRKPDQYSSRLGMFAFVRNTRPGYQSLGFSQVTTTFDTYSADGKFLSRTVSVFSDVAVESLMPKGDEEEITFIARKSFEWRIP